MTRTGTALLLVALSLTACKSAESAAAPQAAIADMTVAATPPPMPAASGAEAAATDGASGKAADPATLGRKLVRTGDLRLQVDDYEPMHAQLDALLRSAGGFVANAQVTHVDGRVVQATLTVRLPTAGYDDALARLAKLGTVLEESTHTDDVTDQWVDVTARLANAKRLEGRLVEMVAQKTGTVADLLEVERELARVREQVELFEGRLRVLDDQVSLSTLTLRVETRSTYVAAAPPTFGSEAGRALSSSWRGLSSLARELTLGGIGLLPWLPLLAVAFFLGRRLKRRYLVPNKRSPASPSPGTM
jgi:hypothetical protein